LYSTFIDFIIFDNKSLYDTITNLGISAAKAAFGRVYKNLPTNANIDDFINIDTRTLITKDYKLLLTPVLIVKDTYDFRGIDNPKISGIKPIINNEKLYSIVIQRLQNDTYSKDEVVPNTDIINEEYYKTVRAFKLHFNFNVSKFCSKIEEITLIRDNFIFNKDTITKTDLSNLKLQREQYLNNIKKINVVINIKSIIVFYKNRCIDNKISQHDLYVLTKYINLFLKSIDSIDSNDKKAFFSENYDITFDPNIRPIEKIMVNSKYIDERTPIDPKYKDFITDALKYYIFIIKQGKPGPMPQDDDALINLYTKGTLYDDIKNLKITGNTFGGSEKLVINLNNLIIQDRIHFILLLFIIHTIATFIVNFSNTKKLSQTTLLYFTIYVSALLLFVILANSNISGVKELFYYLNTNAEDGRGVLRIILQLTCICTLIPIPYIIKDRKQLNDVTLYILILSSIVALIV
jgi:hypothetical protein